MKKNFIFCLFGILLFQFTATAQWSPNTTSTSANIGRTGNVSIGLIPFVPFTERLNVNGNFRLIGHIKGYRTSAKPLSIYGNTSIKNGASISLSGSGTSSNVGRLSLYSAYSGDIIFYTLPSGTAPYERMRVQDNGKVVIGNANVSQPSSGYLLAVDQGIQTEKVKVCPSSSGWCDYVFADDYLLQTIDQVEAFVKKYKHLPNVPSAQEVEDNGIDVAAMDATLLRQIEELWLHMIDMNKKVEALEKENKSLRTQLEARSAKK